MKTDHYAAALALTLLAANIGSAQISLVAWDHSWEYMHPMGALPDVPPGGDDDFDTTWHLSDADFTAQYNGPLFGSEPKLVGDPLLTTSYDSGVSRGPLGYASITYFDNPGAEFTDFGDDDGDAGNGLASELTTPASGQRRAAYFRTTFTVPPDNGPLARPVIWCLIDDGAYIYIDGELIAAVNMPATTPPNRDIYATQHAANSADTEDELRLVELSLPDGSSTGAAPGDPMLAENSRIVKRLTGLSVGEHTLAVSVRSNSQTSSDMAMALNLSAEVGCFIVAEGSNVVRSDAGTPTTPSDDTFFFDVVVTGTGGGASWSSPAPGGTNGAYDVPVTLGPFPISQSPVTVVLTAASDPTCTAQVTATTPTGWVSATATSFTRDQRGTIDPGDDTFTALVTVDSLFASASWTSTGTTPIPASPGTPSAGTYGVPSSFGPYALSAGPVTVGFVDGADPGLTTQITLASPSFIGGKSLAGSPTNLSSDGPLPPQWTNNGATPPTLAMTNPGDDAWYEFRSEVLDLSAIGELGFSAEFVARETSINSNFDGPAGFRARLLLTGTGVPESIDLLAAFDTDADGMLSGTDSTPYEPALDEFNLQQEPESTPLHNVIPLAALVPAAADTVQLVIEGAGLSNSEYFDVRKIAFNDGCAFDLSLTDMFRNSNGDPGNASVHTLEFSLHATPRGLVSPLGWDVTFTRAGAPVAGASVTGGAYNADVAVAGLPAAGGPITVTVADRSDPTCTAVVLLIVPAPPSTVGTVQVGAGTTDLYSDGTANGWTAIPGGLEMAEAEALSEFSTEVVDLSGVTGIVYFSMKLQAMETSSNSNFEAADVFLAELLLDDGVSIIPLNLVTPHDGDTNGQMDADDFDPGAEPDTAFVDNTFSFSAVIPDNITQARLRIVAQVDAPTEVLSLTDVLFTTTPPVVGLDSDGDGASDEDEAIAGTNPADPTSVFRITTLARVRPGTYEAQFPTVAGRFYQGYVSTDLVIWTRDDSILAITGDGNPAAWPFTPVPVAGEPTRYLQVAVAQDAANFPAIMP